MLIVVEGLDGAGKSTQVRKLRQYLEERAGGLDYVHFPRYDAPVYGELIGSYLRGEFGDLNSLHPKLVAFLYAEDRRDASQKLREDLAAGKCVLLDRYVYSNVAFQCAKFQDDGQRKSLKDWIIDMEYGSFGLPRPDLNLFLDVPLDFVRSNLSSGRQGHDRDYLEGHKDIHESDISFQSRVRDMYSMLCAEDSMFKRIDCASPDGGILPPGDVFALVKSEVDKILG